MKSWKSIDELPNESCHIFLYDGRTTSPALFFPPSTFVIKSLFLTNPTYFFPLDGIKNKSEIPEPPKE